LTTNCRSRRRKTLTIDNFTATSIIEIVGEEDKALLRSNLSAYIDAGIEAGDAVSRRPLAHPILAAKR
jgi:hypothetical protein